MLKAFYFSNATLFIKFIRSRMHFCCFIAHKIVSGTEQNLLFLSDTLNFQCKLACDKKISKFFHGYFHFLCHLNRNQCGQNDFLWSRCFSFRETLEIAISVSLEILGIRKIFFYYEIAMILAEMDLLVCSFMDMPVEIGFSSPCLPTVIASSQ